MIVLTVTKLNSVNAVLTFVDLRTPHATTTVGKCNAKYIMIFGYLLTIPTIKKIIYCQINKINCIMLLK